MFVVTVEFWVRESKVDLFRDAVLRQAADSLQQEESCRQFDVCVAPNDPGHLFLYELYDDAEAFDRHLESDHFIAFDDRVREWVKAKSVKTWLSAS